MIALFFFFLPFSLLGDATIIGIVRDSNTSLPISEALVNAIRGNTVRYSTTTAANGTYTLSNINPGNYTLVFSASGYQTHAVGAHPPNNQTTIANASLVPNGGSIQGTVTNAITSLPIAGASVSVFQNRTLIASSTTNGSGTYTISDLPPDSYVVLVSATGFQQQIEGATVSSGMTTTADFALQPNPGSISGQVTDALTSAPIEGAHIAVFKDSILVGFDNTDSSGNYTIPDLVPGDYAVVVTSTDYNSQFVGASVFSNVNTIVNFALTSPPGAIAGRVIDINTSLPIPSATVAVFQDEIFISSDLTDEEGNYEIPDLAPGEYLVVVLADDYQGANSAASVSQSVTTTFNFSLSPNPGAIAGTITDAISTDPISGAVILIFSGVNLITSGVSDANGMYNIDNLPPGNYFVLVRADTYRAALSSETVIAGMTTTADFALTQNPGSVEGQILNLCDNSPLPGAIVVVTNGSAILGFSLTDSDGNYTIDSLAPGDYILRATKQNFFASSSPVTVLSGTATPLSLSLTPKALPPESIRGEVVRNRFLTQEDRIHSISWTASPGSCTTGYEIFRNGALIAFVSASAPLTYLDHNRTSTDVYTVRATNSFGEVSSVISITVSP